MGEVRGSSQSPSSCTLMKWIGVWEPHVPWHVPAGWTKIKLLSLFGLQTIQNLLTLKKREQAESTGKKGDCLDLRMFLLGMYKWCRWHHPTAKGAFWHWCRQWCSPVPLQSWLCSYPREMGFGFKEVFNFSFPFISGHSPFIFLVYSSSTVPALCGSSELSADLAGRWDIGMISHLNALYSCHSGKSHPSPVGFQSGTNHSGVAFGALCLGWWIPGCGAQNRQWLHFLPRSQGCTRWCSH